jgi:hypothetical protein
MVCVDPTALRFLLSNFVLKVNALAAFGAATAHLGVRSGNARTLYNP